MCECCTVLYCTSSATMLCWLGVSVDRAGLTISSPLSGSFHLQRRSVIGALRKRFMAVLPLNSKVMGSARIEVLAVGSESTRR